MCRTSLGPLRGWTHHRGVGTNEPATAPSISAAELAAQACSRHSCPAAGIQSEAVSSFAYCHGPRSNSGCGREHGDEQAFTGMAALPRLAKCSGLPQQTFDPLPLEFGLALALLALSLLALPARLTTLHLGWCASAAS